MRTLMMKAVMGTTLLASALTVAAPAEAQRYYRHRGDSTGPAIVAGVAGLAIGAALASSSHRDRYYDNRYYDGGYPRSYYNNGYNNGYYNDGYYNDGYYDRGYYNAPRRYYRERCRTQWRYDPYYRERVRVRICR